MLKYFLGIYLLLANVAFAQKAGFTLEGNIDIDTGTILLKPIYNSNYYPGKPELNAKIKDGKFSFSGAFSYPAPFYLTIVWADKTDYTSSVFYVDKGNQKISSSVSSPAVSIKNEATAEVQAFKIYLNETTKYIHQLNVAINGMGNDANAKKMQGYMKHDRDSIQQVHNGRILKYTRDHPASFISIWYMIPELNKGYTPFFDTFYAALSPQVKNSVTGRQLGAAVEKLSTVAPGSVFPQLIAYDINDKKTTVAFANKNKYTLVDFWYSGCYPCVRLFPDYKKLYETYHDKGFEIIAISTDEWEHIKDWKRMIQEKQLPWPQYLDRNKTNADKLYIERYPTSFLLDAEGKIIRQDVLPGELDEILKNGLTNN